MEEERLITNTWHWMPVAGTDDGVRRAEAEITQLPQIENMYIVNI